MGEVTEKVTVFLGVPDDPLSKSEKTDPLSCKIGGFPILDDEEALKVLKSQTCRVCGDPMYLLVQAYCPDNDLGRIFFVFCCNSSKCQTKSPFLAWRVWRYQRKGLVENEEDEASHSDDEKPQLDEDGLPAAEGPWAFPELGLDIFEEPEEEKATLEENLRQAEEINAKAEKEGGAYSAEELEMIEKGGFSDHVDPHLVDFHARLSRCPRQVVRWGYGAEPLWLGSEGVPKGIPPCDCGAERVCELQVLSTIVWKLRVDKHPKPTRELGDDGLDFGMATIYSCSKNDEEATGLFEDYCYVQPAPQFQETPP